MTLENGSFDMDRLDELNTDDPEDPIAPTDETIPNESPEDVDSWFAAYHADVQTRVTQELWDEDNPAVEIIPDPEPEPLPHLAYPMSAEEIQAALHTGWKYLGTIDTSEGLRWEADYGRGAIRAVSPEVLVLVSNTYPECDWPTTAQPPAGITINRRRKRRRRITEDLIRCNICAGLVSLSKQQEHLTEVHSTCTFGNVDSGLQQELFTAPVAVPDFLNANLIEGYGVNNHE